MAPNTTRRILGLSPGSRYLGVAVLDDGSLKDWRIIGIDAGCADEKLDRLGRVLAHLLELHHPDVIAMKAAGLHSGSSALAGVTGTIRRFADEHKLGYGIYALDRVKRLLVGEQRANRVRLANELATRYPILYSEIQQRIMRHNSHSLRMFEAVAVASAHVVDTQRWGNQDTYQHLVKQPVARPPDH